MREALVLFAHVYIFSPQLDFKSLNPAPFWLNDNGNDAGDNGDNNNNNKKELLLGGHYVSGME